MNKRPLIALSVLGAVALVLSLGSVGNVRAQDPAPTVASPASPGTGEALDPLNVQQPAMPQLSDAAVGHAMSYQGQLQKSGGVHNGNCNFQFSLWDAATGGAQKGITIAKNAVAVANGLFSVELDFGDQFTGDARWLQTAVQCAGDADFTPLSPRQPQNAVPYALGLWAGLSVRGSHPSAVFTVDNKSGAGLAGYSSGNEANSFGVLGQATSGHGIYGRATTNGNGVVGVADGGGNGVVAVSSLGHAVHAYAKGDGNGVVGISVNGVGGYFSSDSGSLIKGVRANGLQVFSVENDGRTVTNILEVQGGSDLAERFSQADGTVAEPGTVMIIDPDNPGQIKPSAGAYDRKVAGIVSGAGDIRPGLTLHQEGVAEGDTVMAIAGRVYVKAEALSGPIEPGDQLTTSDLAGYAMKASDDARSHGAVIGKAMTGLSEGTGLVLVIVNLQ